MCHADPEALKRWRGRSDCLVGR